MNSTSTMRAVVQQQFGGVDVLQVEQVPRPAPLPTEVLVRVSAAGVNPVDWKTRAGDGMAGVLGQPPFILGWDVSGVVEAVGYGVTRFAPGDEVFGMPWFPRQAGAYAEYVTGPSRQFARKPVEVDHVTAAALPLAGLTAWHAVVDTAGVGPGDRVLVHAAAGGVGHLAVQLAARLGAHVIATAGAANHDYVRGLGAAEVIDYRQTRFEERVADIDVVVDLAGDGADRTSTRSLAVLRPGGLLLAVPGCTPELQQAGERRGVRVTGLLVEPDATALEQLGRLVAAGELHVTVARTLPLEGVAAAHTAGETNHTRGKLVLDVAA